MKRKMILIQILLIAMLLILCGFALFGCASTPEAPEVTNVSITAVDGNSCGKAGALHQVNYTVPEGCKVATSVKLGDAFATMADYSYIDGGYIFYAAGEYTITVYASRGGMLGSAEAKITVAASETSVSDVQIKAAAGETLGKAGALHVLSYAADADCEIQVDIKKDGVTATDVEFNSEYNTIVFGSAGQYTVKVTATIGEASDSAEAQIEISAADAPAVTLTLDKTAGKEDEEITLNHTVAYPGGDSRKEESVSALYRAGSTGEYRVAEAGSYTVNGDRFTPHIAGEWKIVYKALSRGGAEGEASAEFKCNPAEISLSSVSGERQRIRTFQATDLNYNAEGAAEKYNVTYDVHGANGVEAQKGEGNSVRVTAANVEYFTVTVIYTHKVVTTLKKTVDIDIYSVDSLAYAPAWGADPFDGMPSEVLTSVGHMFYFDATSCGGSKRELTGRNAMFEVVSASVSSGASVDIMSAGDNDDYPYVLVSNFGNNSATGSFTIKMTLTDPATGYSAVARKNFTVSATGNNAAVIRDYVKNNSFYNIAQMNFDNAAQYSQENMVLTKTGTIMQRSNADFSTGDFAHMDFEQAAVNCRLEFKFTQLARNPSSGEVWLGIGLRTVTANGWAGFFDLHIVGGKLDITNGLDNNKATAEYLFGAERPLAENNTTMFVRIDRRVNGSLAEYTISVKTEDSAVFEPYYRCTFGTSTSGGNAGAPVKQYQFTHRYAGGCYVVEDISVINYN